MPSPIKLFRELSEMIYRKRGRVPGTAESLIPRSRGVTSLWALTTCQAGCSDLAGQLWDTEARMSRPQAQPLWTQSLGNQQADRQISRGSQSGVHPAGGLGPGQSPPRTQGHVAGEALWKDSPSWG